MSDCEMEGVNKGNCTIYKKDCKMDDVSWELHLTDPSEDFLPEKLSPTFYFSAPQIDRRHPRLPLKASRILNAMFIASLHNPKHEREIQRRCHLKQPVQRHVPTA